MKRTVAFTCGITLLFVVFLFNNCKKEEFTSDKLAGTYIGISTHQSAVVWTGPWMGLDTTDFSKLIITAVDSKNIKLTFVNPNNPSSQFVFNEEITGKGKFGHTDGSGAFRDEGELKGKLYFTGRYTTIVVPANEFSFVGTKE
jgi:hypothetical protein